MGDEDRRRIKTFGAEERFQPGVERQSGMSCEEVRAFLEASEAGDTSDSDATNVGAFLEHVRLCRDCAELIMRDEDGDPSPDAADREEED